MPDICKNSLISTTKFAKAGYITVFDDKEVNVYDTQNTKVIVTWQAIIKRWFDKNANLWQIPLVPIVLNNNIGTVLVKKTPTEFLPDRPPPAEAIHNVYELKTQPELVRYLLTHSSQAPNKTNMDSSKKRTNNMRHGRDLQ